ncbi:hypothetical protein BD311DRAFT_756774 [Dichomitus squalens]|uniref:BTB domain-containing protein n=1 Tax=Dichomitus squalens TaxID=114155 RepID=A0A4Q9MSD2_9APHY|nr:hypothetical protein BD311DRAFT_756774 [Dichomitus squalens]
MSQSSDKSIAVMEPHSYTRDNDFFIDVKPLYLRAEGTLFCVPRHYFEKSEVWEGLFTLPATSDSPREGLSEDYPLFLESIKADDLREFLRVLSCRLLAAGDGTSIRFIPTSWLPVLKLASLWDFPKLRALALKYLKSQDCMTRLRISRQYDVKEWFLPALKEVAVRTEPLTMDDVKELGLEFALKVMALREKARGAPCIASDLHDYDIDRILGKET